MDRLLVFLGFDYKQRERIVEIIAREQQFDQAFKKTAAPDHYFLIQFQIQLPFEVQELASNQVASLILFLNQLLDWPGFELNELNNRVSYRYVWLIKQTALDEYLITNIIGNLMLCLDMFTETIEHIATSQATFNELLEQILQFSSQIRPAPPA
ncbi:hypothetical protein [Candidatus Protochlamydia phocaeensis]|uniref:hypothetical protein n=1 Tax=Candidatus Protochlamydia phocaeensis TaxID=1414722 RepID=UPI0012AB898F|nr:hypothetical protein [Candidatus Protochlamydia phocaeensis]